MTLQPELARRADDGLAAAPLWRTDVTGRVRLLGSRCQRCLRVAFPRRAICLTCFGDHDRWTLGGAGTVHAWTLLVNPPSGFGATLPYGCVDLDEGPRLLGALIAGPADVVRTGDRVHAVEAPVRDGRIGFRFEVHRA